LRTAHQFAYVYAQVSSHGRQLLHIHLLRIQPQVHHRRTDGQRLTKTIGNHAAHGRLNLGTYRTLSALFKQERLFHGVQHHQPHQHRQQQQRKHAQHQPETPAGNALWLWFLFTRLSVHLRSTCTCCASVMLNCLRAHCPSRPWALSVLRSSNSLVYSCCNDKRRASCCCHCCSNSRC